MIKMLGYIMLFWMSAASALVPVEGIILGDAQADLQTDPLRFIFSDIFDKSKVGENKKLKLYQSTYESGQRLGESCSYLEASKYSTPFQETQARRSVVATLQYIGLDTSIKAIGAYAKKLDLSQEAFENLKTNLINNYCSKNITVFSLKNIARSLTYYYENPENDLIPSIESSPFATELMKTTSSKPEARSKEFDLVIRNFRAFCSWGTDVEDYRMLTSYLGNKFIMAFVNKNLTGFQNKIDEKQQKVILIPETKATVQVVCDNIICRKENFSTFKAKFPLSVGSTGLSTDLSKMFCHHFRFQDSPKTSIPQVKAWIKTNELEDPILETSQFISLMTGVPDFFNGSESYRDIPLLVRSSIDERWNLWSKKVLNIFSKDLLYEESLKVKIQPRRDLATLQVEGFEVDLSVTLGELDRLMVDHDKLALSFDLILSKNFLRSIKAKWLVLVNEVDAEGKERHKNEIAQYINIQLKEKEKLYTQKLWNDDFAKLIAEELLQQTLVYRGKMFDSYKEEMLRVPVKFSYGMFALGYIRYRSDVATGRLKLNL